MKVWIDQDLCTGDGLCEEIAPDVFTLLDDGLAYVKEGSKVFNEPGGADGLANIPDGQLDAVIESVWLGETAEDGVLLSCGRHGTSIDIDTRPPAAHDLGDLGCVEVVEARTLAGHGPLQRIAMLEASPTRHPIGVVLGFADGASACVFKDGDELRLTIGRDAEAAGPLEITLF